MNLFGQQTGEPQKMGAAAPKVMEDHTECHVQSAALSDKINKLQEEKAQQTKQYAALEKVLIINGTQDIVFGEVDR